MLIIASIPLVWLVMDIKLLFDKYTNNEDYIISENVRVVDGDTIVLNNISIRLQGIDAPESGQQCKLKNNGKLFYCGLAATDYLKALIESLDIITREKIGIKDNYLVVILGIKILTN